MTWAAAAWSPPSPIPMAMSLGCCRTGNSRCSNARRPSAGRPRAVPTGKDLSPMCSDPSRPMLRIVRPVRTGVRPAPEAAECGTISGVTTSPAATQHLRDLALLRRVRDRMDREYAQPLDVEALARGAHMSAGHLSREFKLAYGESPYSYLMTRRIERAMALLQRGDLSVTEVCFAVGCSSLGTFSTRFTELVGMSPSAYRESAYEMNGVPPCVVKQVARPIRNREAPTAGSRL